MLLKKARLLLFLPLISIGCLDLFSCVSSAATLNVPSLEYSTIQSAIAAAFHRDIVLVADGTYKDGGNKNLDFKGKAISVKSQNGPSNSIIDCEGDGRGFSFDSYEGKASHVEGFTITNGGN
jgi:hypothetical protein